MKINVFADTICGWCFIGHINLNNALKKFSNIKFDIHHIPFQLNPDMPANRSQGQRPIIDLRPKIPVEAHPDVGRIA